MKSYETEYGALIVASKEALFEHAMQIAESHFAGIDRPQVSWALTGGSTPKDFYRWLVAENRLSVELLDRILWTTSDERTVPLESEESNFGNADRLLLGPLRTIQDHKLPWPTQLQPRSAATAYAESWHRLSGGEQGYDLCFVGMGDDCHTLSLFPGSPLLESPLERSFAAVEVPGKGWRLTLTRSGLGRCGKVVLTTLGAGKAEALQAVLEGDFDPVRKPSQILRSVADRAVWLVDEAAAARLSL